MELELVFNELSWEHPASSVEEARECANRLVLTMSEATRRGVKRAVRTTCDLQQLQLGPGYYWWHWREDPEVRRELQTYFRSIATKYPALLDEAEVAHAMQGCDYFMNGQRALGLGIACRMDSLALSMLSSNEWDTPVISLEVHELLEEKIERRLEDVRHVARPEHAPEAHGDWIKRRLTSLVENGSELWKRSSEFFPSLLFCTDVAEQMRALPKPALASILRGLFRLDDYARGWIASGFDPDQVQCDVSPESDSTMNLFAQERTFVSPDGRSVTFSWHAKVGGPWRVYFHPGVGPGRLLVGYVGKHLRTAKYR